MLPSARRTIGYSLESLPDLLVSLTSFNEEDVQVVQSRAFVLQVDILRHIAYPGTLIWSQRYPSCKLTIKSLRIQ